MREATDRVIREKVPTCMVLYFFITYIIQYSTRQIPTLNEFGGNSIYTQVLTKFKILVKLMYLPTYVTQIYVEMGKALNVITDRLTEY